MLLLETLRVLKKGGTFAIHDLMSERRYGDMQAFVQKLREMGCERVELIDTTTGKFMPPKEAKRLMSDLLIELSCMQDWPEHYFGAVFDCEENLKSILSICKHHMPRWETDEVFFDKSDDTEYGKVSYVRFHMITSY